MESNFQGSAEIMSSEQVASDGNKRNNSNYSDGVGMEDSDVELEGMDVDDDIDESNGDNVQLSAQVETQNPSANAGNKLIYDNERATKEAHEMDDARQERQEYLAAEHKRLGNKQVPNSAQERLEYLLAQSDVFAHFLAGSIASSSTASKKKKGSRGRLTEAEEDAQLLKSAQSKRRIIRVDQQPSNLASHCKMRSYQLEGLNWMIKLHDHGINGILADEMGLGKTLQAISFIAYLRESRGTNGPHLVIVPKSIVGNWIRELNHWCPSIRSIRMGGCKEERINVAKNHLQVASPPNFDVLVTSYEGALKEKGKLSKVHWNYLIIDEAHRIKNENSSLSKAVREMRTDFRLLITGTPLQNNLRELWALLNFLMPDIFGDAEQFDAWFSLEDHEGKENVIRKLHTVLRPFMLRRVKKDVAKDLPPKKEIKLYIGLTEMQRDWYVRCLHKDAYQLNKLGGPDRTLLLNVLMQLRKVCNHPYLFDGAEAGPPYSDGPHLWENSGKMLLLNKLLPKLKANNSRVLIFSQMTRVLDILEDYCRLLGFLYCRIDGKTDGELRDSQIDEFNKPGSEKFLFLLSTRAGGLGINLATADVVILYDSDWNPQVDLQAMDRAHRIGQTKPVQVFRFITEGTVEEKITERADRKLFLDAAVIQQGRLAEQNSSLQKDELMKMVRFGADEIFNRKGGTFTDEDIDALIARGNEKTEAIQAKLKTDAKHDLANFSLIADDDNEKDTFSFGGKNYRGAEKNVGNFINLPQRQRKRNYDIDYDIGDGQDEKQKSPPTDNASKKKKKGNAIYDFQLYDMYRLNEIQIAENAIKERREKEVKMIESLKATAANALPYGQAPQGYSREEILRVVAERERLLPTLCLPSSMEAEMKALLKEGYPNWSKKDFRCFCSALERHSRFKFTSVAQDVMKETDKSMEDVKRYFLAFFTKYKRINDWQRIIDKIERAEKRVIRLQQIKIAIKEKVERHLEQVFGQQSSTTADSEPTQPPTAEEMVQFAWPYMEIDYGSLGHPKGYQAEEDSFLVCQMYLHGYGAAEKIRMEIRKAWQFRLDWYFKSRSAVEIQKRCDAIVKVIERENKEYRSRKKTQEDAEVIVID